MKQNSNKAAGTDSQSNQQTFDTTTVPVRLAPHTCNSSLWSWVFMQASMHAEVLEHASTCQSDVTALPTGSNFPQDS